MAAASGNQYSAANERWPYGPRNRCPALGDPQRTRLIYAMSMEPRPLTRTISSPWPKRGYGALAGLIRGLAENMHGQLFIARTYPPSVRSGR
jgi:hypothetical protein